MEGGIGLMFVDSATIKVEGGTGGSGAEAFRREYGVPRGGPSGGDGGAGGSVILVCDAQLSTLLDLRYRAEYRAPRGQHGEGSDKSGASGEDLEVHVPPGTIVTDAETGERLGELLEDGSRMVVAKGGRGGRGNARFATATRQAPRRWEPGEEGERRTIELNLKLIADVGLVGEPNAGKSTFLAAVSHARPKIADYPFTTLTPQLGVVQLPDYRSFVVADIPGIIEGAHEGKGLGHQFLQHIERTRTLALLVPVDDPDPPGTYRRLRDELARYSSALADRPHCLVLTKSDLLESGSEPPDFDAPDAWGRFLASSVTGEGMAPLLEALWRRARRAAADPRDAVEKKPEGPESSTKDAEPAEESAEESWWRSVDQEH